MKDMALLLVTISMLIFFVWFILGYSYLFCLSASKWGCTQEEKNVAMDGFAARVALIPIIFIMMLDNTTIKRILSKGGIK